MGFCPGGSSSRLGSSEGARIHKRRNEIGSPASGTYVNLTWNVSHLLRRIFAYGKKAVVQNLLALKDNQRSTQAREEKY
jgi:hypothetical protein